MSCASLQRFDTWPRVPVLGADALLPRPVDLYNGGGGLEGLFAHDRHRVVDADQHLRREIRCTFEMRN